MTAPVDVLFVMREGAALLSVSGRGVEALGLIDAHDAVAELIEAGDEWCALMPGLAGGPEFDRLVTALARVGGAK